MSLHFLEINFFVIIFVVYDTSCKLIEYLLMLTGEEINMDSCGYVSRELEHSSGIKKGTWGIYNNMLHTNTVSHKIALSLTYNGRVGTSLTSNNFYSTSIRYVATNTTCYTGMSQHFI